jgi:lipopolysaccharide transport system ATP-binding protein
MIEVKNISKCYDLRTRLKHKTLKETLYYKFRKHAHKPGIESDHQKLWSLKNVSFQIEQGEIVGLIGANGAGKTTLLKILSRITKPSHGEARIYGKVGALLGAGTGFHMELTGDENIFLRGAILGIPRSVIRKKYKEIVEFSGIESFIFSPVKTYSQGMRARLAFSIDINFQPDILLLDEALAVGDAEFAQKSQKKMHEVLSSGSTVILVNHNIDTIVDICHRAIWLDKGEIVEDGPVDSVAKRYTGFVLS